MPRVIKDHEFASWLMYPKVFTDYMADRTHFGNVSVLPTRAFFYGLEPGEEITVDLEKGKHLIIRYVAVCLLAGYFWLAVGGALVALQVAYDAALHAIFVGFVFSMVFGHAPVILPAPVYGGVYAPAPVVVAPRVVYRAQRPHRVYYAPAPVVYGPRGYAPVRPAPRHYGGYGGYGDYDR